MFELVLIIVIVDCACTVKSTWFSKLGITASEVAAVNKHILGIVEVDAICVGAVTRRWDANIKNLNVCTRIKLEVHLRAILYSNACNCHITAAIEPECLHAQVMCYAWGQKSLLMGSHRSCWGIHRWLGRWHFTQFRTNLLVMVKDLISFYSNCHCIWK